MKPPATPAWNARHRRQPARARDRARADARQRGLAQDLLAADVLGSGAGAAPAAAGEPDPVDGEERGPLRRSVYDRSAAGRCAHRALRLSLGRTRSATSVLAAMAKYCGVPVGDFRLPVALAWAEKAERLLARLRAGPAAADHPAAAGGRRPAQPALGQGQARAQSGSRSPIRAARPACASAISSSAWPMRSTGVEWMIGPAINADAEFHRGELDFETLAALTARAALVYCSPCFLTVLAQAVETPMVCVFGGFEGANSSPPARASRPGCRSSRNRACPCWNWNCRHDKTIDIAAARRPRSKQFIRESQDTADAEYAEEPAGAADARAAA